MLDIGVFVPEAGKRINCSTFDIVHRICGDSDSKVFSAGQEFG